MGIIRAISRNNNFVHALIYIAAPVVAWSRFIRSDYVGEKDPAQRAGTSSCGALRGNTSWKTPRVSSAGGLIG